VNGPTTAKPSSVSDLSSSALPQCLEAALRGAELHLAFIVTRMVRIKRHSPVIQSCLRFKALTILRNLLGETSPQP